MKKIFFYLASLLLVSCVSPEESATVNLDNSTASDPISKSIKFGFTSIESTASKHQTFAKGTNDDITIDAASIVISIIKSTGEPVYTNEKIDLVRVGNDILSLPLSFLPGDYDITLFQVLDDSGKAIAMTPKTGSTFSNLVTTTLDYRFSATEESTNRVNLQVISTEFAQASDFGYSTFSFVEVAAVVDQFLVQVSTYDSFTTNFELTDVKIKVTNAVTGQVYTNESYPASTTLMVIPKTNDSDLVVIEASKAGYETVTVSKTLVELRQYFDPVPDGNGPLIIVLLKNQYSIIQDSDTIFDFSGETLTATSTSWTSKIGIASIPIGGVYTSDHDGGIVLNGTNQNFGRISATTLGFTSTMTGWSFEFLGIIQGNSVSYGIMYDGTSGEDDSSFTLGSNASGLSVLNRKDFSDGNTLTYTTSIEDKLVYVAGSVDIANQIIRVFINGKYSEQSTGWNFSNWPISQNLQGTISLGYRSTQNRNYYNGSWHRFIGHKKALGFDELQNNYNYFKSKYNLEDLE